MLCIVTKGLQSKCITTRSLNMAITGQFLCSTSLLDSGLLTQRKSSVFGETVSLFRCFMFAFSFFSFFIKKSPA